VEAGKTATISFDLVKVEIPTAPPSAGSGSFSGETISGALPGMTFVKIPSGSFQMGSNEDDSEKPIHPVNIKSFYMMTTEVTQAMWKEIMGDNPSNWKGDNLPVECVSWNDVQEFLKKLNQRDPGRNYRLPSEAEWEYACRAGTTTRYYNGDNANTLGEIAWYGNNSGNATHPVGQKKANSWGLYDMSGNVWEWCEDYWHDDYTGAPTNGSAWLSPSSSYRVLRGGSWIYFDSSCRSADRSYYYPSYRSGYDGFRLVRSP
jgi:formylglycine-generating enzyme required for sulfatase activity